MSQLPDKTREQYERSKLEWMLSHGYGLDNVISELQRHIDFCKEEEGRDVLARRPLQEIFDEWELESGFGSEIWPCYNEWLDCEARKTNNLDVGGYAVVDDTQIAKNEQKLWARFEQSMAEHREKWLGLTPDALIDKSREITAVQDAHHFLMREYEPIPEETALLLQCADPLDYFAGYFEGNMENLEHYRGSFDDALHALKQEAAQREKQEADSPQKPSVMEKLRQKAEGLSKPHAPAPARPQDKEAR